MEIFPPPESQRVFTPKNVGPKAVAQPLFTDGLSVQKPLGPVMKITLKNKIKFENGKKSVFFFDGLFYKK